MIAARETDASSIPCCVTWVFCCLVPGPGPGRYSLPPTIGFVNHDYTRLTSPAYSLHRRLDDSVYLKDASPGPCYYVEPQLTRFGRARGPAYSMRARAKPRGHPQTPGPGTYSPEKAPLITRRQAPSFTMGTRTACRVTDPVPAPNRYALPSLLGARVPAKPSSPSFTISGRHQKGSYSEDLAQTPGPGRYNSTDPSTYLRRPPAFSMLGRRIAPKPAFQTPGPGTHSPEKVTAHRTRAPAYSLGVRHSDFLTPLIVDVSQ
ncbi:outer dense fiber protein 3-like protein 2 [Alligator mississippiensis]|uniref:Outer dense fiber protein 3-like protein 2 n=1 Tax=Alligator mississippiensis TaxID=8496 RepID=A0A151P0S7_ALLMI|nr:outer dense fiber protein 3-like protein 2 [Alligator mississippiensis]